MKYTPNDAQHFTIAGGTKGHLFPAHPSGEQSIACVEASGVYPEHGVSVNDRCTETLYVIEGLLEVTVNGVANQLTAGELIMILPGERYSIRGTGKVLDCITPAWDGKQNHIEMER